MRVIRTALLGVGTALLAVAAQAGPPLRVTVPEMPLTVGDPLRVEVSAVDRALTWDALEVVGAGETWAVLEPPSTVAPGRWELVLAPLATGELPLPRLEANARDAAGAVRTAAAEQPVVEVRSVLPPEGEAPAPAPLAPPIGAPGLPWEWAVPALLALLPAALLAVWWSRRRRHGREVDTTALPAPEVELGRLLAELEREIGTAPATLVCDRLAHGVRRYLERRTAEPAGEMTSAELRALARRRGWPEPARRGVDVVLGTADAVRFARRPAATEALRGALAQAAAAAQAMEAAQALEAEAAARAAASPGEGR